MTILLFWSCNNSGYDVVSVDTELRYRESSRSSSENSDLITQLDIWVVSPSSEKPIMNPSDQSLKTPTDWSTELGGTLDSIELVVGTQKSSTFWIRISAIDPSLPGLVRDFVGSSTIYITNDTNSVKITLYETPSSLLNSSAYEYEEYINSNF